MFNGQGSAAAAKVLVIEDSDVIRQLIEVCLRPLGVVVAMAPNGPAGLESAAVDEPDLVLLDIGLPGMDGWQVLSSLRAAGADCPVVMITSHGETWNAEDAARRGADGFMTKPFLPENLRFQIMGQLAVRTR